MDPTLKRLFGHAEVVEILVRDTFPEHADRIDFSTLEKVGTELVGEALARRYADLIWTARTVDDTRHVLILTEFQGSPDPIMALRTTIYAHLALQELLQRRKPRLRREDIDVLPPIVMYHGPDFWKAPTALDDVFPQGIPRELRMVQGDPEGGGSAISAQLVGAMTRLQQDTSMKGALAELARLRKIAGKTGDSLDRLLADSVGTWLVSMDRITEEQKRKATTMAQVMTEYERSLEEFGRRRERKGRTQERSAVLVRLARRRFGAEAGDRLAGLFGTPADAARLASAEEAVIDCATAEELLRRVEGSGGG